MGWIKAIAFTALMFILGFGLWTEHLKSSGVVAAQNEDTVSIETPVRGGDDTEQYVDEVSGYWRLSWAQDESSSNRRFGTWVVIREYDRKTFQIEIIAPAE